MVMVRARARAKARVGSDGYAPCEDQDIVTDDDEGVEEAKADEHGVRCCQVEQQGEDRCRGGGEHRACRTVKRPRESSRDRLRDAWRHHGRLLLRVRKCFIPGARCTDASMFVRLPIHLPTYLLTFHVSVNTKMSSAPMQRIRKRPSISRLPMVVCDHKYFT
eukprot:scaffold41021_cov69-Phaeocystis_antarctica.AAC.4